MQRPPFPSRALRRGLVLALAVVATALAGCPRRGGERPEARVRDRPAARLVVLGFDGVDPRWLRRFAEEGKLPTMKRLMEAHGGRAFRELGSTIPPQSPVAWASFATGTDPGEHGIFD